MSDWYRGFGPQESLALGVGKVDQGWRAMSDMVQKELEVASERLGNLAGIYMLLICEVLGSYSCDINQLVRYG